ncbi:CaiB/BaiF CoA transferase family protein [Paenarthrobacter sp. 2TAF44]|uniref:CaiB/BaiF CoA transferase family protein n=1 Tax=Paenarthrobacter sp. 2TAF44 TaxID=3233018 RepID=UPI003F98A686
MLPLSGITVVSLEQAVAAPFATRQLADLGARIIKIERPDVGDFARGYDETVKGMASHFVWLNRSKESVALDLKSPEGHHAVHELVRNADIFVQNLAPGAAERLGLGADALRAERPELIHVSISGYGADGPYSSKKAYDLLVQCEAGLVSITGSEETPSKVGISIADIASGMYAYSGILTALLQRGQTGEGATIELSMLEALGEWMGYAMNYAVYGGTAPQRTGSSHAAIAPYGPFTCGDSQQVFLGIQNEREWATFCERVLGRPMVALDERFARNSLRVKHRADLTLVIQEGLSRYTADEVVDLLEKAGIANALLRDMQGFADHPQLTARNRWREYDSPVGPLRALIPPATFVGQEPVMGRVPNVGEDTERVLAEFKVLETT